MADEHLEGDVGREKVDAEKDPAPADEPKAEGPGGAAPTEEIRMPLNWSVTRAVEEPGSPEPGKVDQNAETKKWPLDPVPEPAAAEVEAPEAEPEAPKPPKKKRARRKKPVSKSPRRPRKKPAKGRAKRPKKARA